MAVGLTAPVGDPRRGATNHTLDVLNAQNYLNNWITFGALKTHVSSHLSTGGKMTDEMIQTIGTFQKVVVGFRNPDYRIDPGGRTWQVLSGRVTTTPQNIRTDRLPEELYKKRIQLARQRGDKVVGSLRMREVEFATDFDVFSAKVAYALRHLIVYRTDGGKFARGLVRHSPDLKLIHDAYLTVDAQEGEPIVLEAFLFRRKEPIAANRWVMYIRFRAPNWEFEEGFEGDDVEGDTRTEREKIMAKILVCAEVMADQIKGGQIGVRIRRMVKIADEIGFPRNENLWYYNPHPVGIYMDWRTDDKQRAVMTSATGGRMPFDGYAHPENWRATPFDVLIRQVARHDPDSCYPGIKSALLVMHDSIFSTLEILERAGGAGQSGKILGEKPPAFKAHVLSLIKNDPGHLYHAFKD